VEKDELQIKIACIMLLGRTSLITYNKVPTITIWQVIELFEELILPILIGGPNNNLRIYSLVS